MLISNTHKQEEYYRALLNRDKQYVGVFFVGVKTTKIFCISTCSARKPKFENVEFHSHPKTLLLKGFRPCKICKPTQNSYSPPPYILRALDLLHQKDDMKLKDYELRQNGLKPEQIRRWFKKSYGITFHAYQRMLRINTAFSALQNGNAVTDAGFNSGYESLSGFGHAFKKIVGSSPKDSKNKQVILMSRFGSPLGPLFACASVKGLCLLEFTDRRMLETELKDLQKRLNAVILVGENEHIRQVKKELEQYFSGERKNFEVPLHTPGTDFQQSVWNSLLKIPFGATRSYQKVAAELGNPLAVRAVARANGSNRVAILIPCHRVIGKNGKLTGYGGGLERKRWLLEHESNGPAIWG